ncbi:MAG: J domain-containing protein [Magnetococcales bacterium]|nr:J domain-containing protein [Magnetococcales bacterium]
MKNPFHILNIEPDADDEAVHAAYQRLIAIHSKTASPTRAKEIEWAYDTIKNPRDRISFKLFQTPTPDIPTLLGPSLSNPTSATPNKEKTLAVIKNSLKTFQLPLPE